MCYIHWYLEVSVVLRVLTFDISEDWPKKQNFVLTNINYVHWCCYNGAKGCHPPLTFFLFYIV